MKIVVVGVGRVGATVAYALLQRRIARELVLVGRDEERTRAEALDLAHAAVLAAPETEVRAGRAGDTAGAGLIVVCASVRLPEPHQRFDFAVGNARMFQELLPPLVEHSPDAVLLIVTNPVDVMTWHALQITGLSAARVIGSGTLLDTMRFRTVAAREPPSPAAAARAWVLGDHGPEQFATAGEGGTLDEGWAREMVTRTIREGRWVYERKGYTSFGIATAVAEIASAIARDERRVLPVSSYLEDYAGVSGVCLSLPCVVGAGGVVARPDPALTPSEIDALRASAAKLREVIDASSAAEVRAR